MIGIDTNVLLRLVLRDDPRMTPAAEALMASLTEQEPGFISHVTLCELVWTLGRHYKRTRPELVELIDRLDAAAELRLERVGVVRDAAAGFHAGGAGFSDHLIAAVHRAEGLTDSVTFDRKLARLPGWRLLTAPG